MSQETHDSIMTAIQTYSEENGKFVDKGIKASATRARKALAESIEADQSKKKRDSRSQERGQKSSGVIDQFVECICKDGIKPPASNSRGFFYLRIPLPCTLTRI